MKSPSSASLALALALIPLAWGPSRAADPACDEDKKKHFENARKVYSTLDLYYRGRVMAMNGTSGALASAAPATCEERNAAWKAMETLLKGTPYDKQGTLIEEAVKELPAEAFYYVAGVDAARRALPKCDEAKKDTDPNCKDRAAKLKAAIEKLKNPGKWTLKIVEPAPGAPQVCLSHPLSDTAGVEVIPDAWIDALLPALDDRALWLKTPADKLEEEKSSHARVCTPAPAKADLKKADKAVTKSPLDMELK